MPLCDLLAEVPFPELKSAYVLAGMAAPRGFDHAKSMFEAFVDTKGETEVRGWMRRFFDPADVVVFQEPVGWDREDRLGARARANVLVSTLVVLGEGNPGPLRILGWK